MEKKNYQGKTLFAKIWDAHVVSEIPEGPIQLYIDRHFCHEVTSPQAFNGLRKRGLKVFRPEKTTITADHNTPTLHQDKPVKDPISKNQLDTLSKNAKDFNMPLFFPLGHKKNGVVHIIGPENGFTQPKWYSLRNVFCKLVQKQCVSHLTIGCRKMLLLKTSLCI